MDRNLLSKTAAAMVAKGKGLLAADESSGTCEKRFKSVGVDCTGNRGVRKWGDPVR
jgi:fructose-bisphosphate aldolase class I